MSERSTDRPTIELARWLEAAAPPTPRAAMLRLAIEAFVQAPARPYDDPGGDAGGGPRLASPAGTEASGNGALRGGGNVAYVVPGRTSSLRPLVVAAQIDRTGAGHVAGLAAALAVPALVARADLERDVIFVLFDDGAVPAARGRPHVPPARAGAHHWFDLQRRHDVKAAVVLHALGVGRRSDLSDGLIWVAGVETDARMPTVLEGAAPAGGRLLLTRHGADGLPFAAHGVPYLAIGRDDPPPRAAAPGSPQAADIAALQERAASVALLATRLLARLDAARLPGPFNGYDSTDVELAALEVAMGPQLAALGGRPRGRPELERVLAGLI